MEILAAICTMFQKLSPQHTPLPKNIVVPVKFQEFYQVNISSFSCFRLHTSGMHHSVPINVDLSKVLNYLQNRGDGAVSLSVCPASGRLGVRIPAAADLCRKTSSDSSAAKRSAIGMSVRGPRR